MTFDLEERALELWNAAWNAGGTPPSLKAMTQLAREYADAKLEEAACILDENCSKDSFVRDTRTTWFYAAGVVRALKSAPPKTREQRMEEALERMSCTCGMSHAHTSWCHQKIALNALEDIE